jgi:hypothetical protein
MENKRKIVMLEGRKATVYCKNGKVYEGFGNIPCIANENDEDVDGILFTLNNGVNVILTEADIEKIEFSN